MMPPLQTNPATPALPRKAFATVVRWFDAALGATLRMVWMSCTEVFGYDGGNQWGVAHHRFGKHARA